MVKSRRYDNVLNIDWRIELTKQYIKNYPEDEAAKRALQRLEIMKDKESNCNNQ